MGIFTFWSALASNSPLTPSASLPSTRATLSGHWSFVTSSAPSSAVAHRANCRFLHQAASASTLTPVKMGKWNRLPMVLRTTLGLYRSAVFSIRTTATAPRASAVRIRVPRFPGSRIWSSTSTMPFSGAKASRSSCFSSTRAATLWGSSVAVIFCSTGRGTSYQGRALPCALSSQPAGSLV